MNDDIEDLISQIRKLNEKYPNKVKRELRNLINLFNSANNNYENKIIPNDIDKEKLLAVIICTAMALLGFINVFSNPEAGVYFFGLVFFLAGFFVGVTQKGFGLIFLFSHGVTGLGIMVGFVLKDIFNNPLLQDGINNIHIYLGITLLIFVLAIITTAIRNLSDSFKNKQYSLLIPLSLFFIGLFMVTLLPKIFNFIYNL